MHLLSLLSDIDVKKLMSLSSEFSKKTFRQDSDLVLDS